MCRVGCVGEGCVGEGCVLYCGGGVCSLFLWGVGYAHSIVASCND